MVLSVIVLRNAIMQVKNGVRMRDGLMTHAELPTIHARNVVVRYILGNAFTVLIAILILGGENGDALFVARSFLQNILESIAHPVELRGCTRKRSTQYVRLVAQKFLTDVIESIVMIVGS